MTRRAWAKAIWVAVGAWVMLVLLSLRYGFFDAFFYDMAHGRSNPAIDLFPVIRGYANLVDGRSIFDTFASSYGPYSTWYLYHPALALALGSWLSRLGPWSAFHVWTAVSLLLMGVSAWLIARRGDDPVRKPLVWLLMLGSFPLMVMLRAGNVQSVLVLALTLVLVSLDAMREAGSAPKTRRMLFAGLLLSLLSKPAVLLILPLLVCLRETRRTALKAAAVYGAVSIVFLIVPALNPVAMSWSARWELATHPALVRETMDVYTNGFVVTQPMKDNSIHWLEMAAMTDFRLQNIDVYALPVFLDGLFDQTRTPAVWYRIPGIMVVEMSLLVLLATRGRARFDAALPVVMATLLMFFLSFGIVWEYDYTVVFPMAGVLLMRTKLSRAEWAIVGLTALLWGPNLFFLTTESEHSLTSLMTVMRADRILPVVAIFCMLLGCAGAKVYRALEPALARLARPVASA